MSCLHLWGNTGCIPYTQGVSCLMNRILYYSTFRTMCAVLNTTAFCILMKSCFPGTSFIVSQLVLDRSPVSMIIGITFIFILHILCISICNIFLLEMLLGLFLCNVVIWRDCNVYYETLTLFFIFDDDVRFVHLVLPISLYLLVLWLLWGYLLHDLECGDIAYLLMLRYNFWKYSSGVYRYFAI